MRITYLWTLIQGTYKIIFNSIQVTETLETVNWYPGITFSKANFSTNITNGHTRKTLFKLVQR